MSTTAILLILLSALLHALWNVLGKQESPSTAFFLVTNAVGVVMLTPALILYAGGIPFFSWRVWMFIGFTGLCQAIYNSSLATAYRTGDVSVAYPIIRSSPVMVTTAIIFLLGRGNELSNLAILGSILVVVGCFFLPMRNFTDFRLSNYLCLSCGMAFLAALGTTGYSLIDDEALRELRNSPEIGLEAYEVSLLYAFFLAVSSTFWLIPFTLIPAFERKSLKVVLKNRLKKATLVGVLIYITYPLVLLSMAFTTNVGYVVAFRQVSVPLGGLMGIFLLGEPRHLPKFVGMGIVFAGLIFVGLG